MPRWLKLLLVVIVPLIVAVLAWVDAQLYQAPIVEAIRVTNQKAEAITDENQNQDHQTNQVIRARYLNTKRKGQTVSLNNTFTDSGTIDFEVKTGNQLFVTSGKSPQIKDLKRDWLLLSLLSLFIVVLALTMRRQFWMTLISLVLNTGLFYLAVHVDVTNQQLSVGLLFSGLAIAFTLITAVFIVGLKPLAGVISGVTVLATGLAVALGYAIMTLTNYAGIHLETVKYVTQAPQLLFYIQVVIGALGAVLDIVGDISMTLAASPQTGKARFQTGMALGRDILGPLINVLLMIFMVGTFSEAILWLRNSNSIAQTVEWVMGLGLAQTLISAFGIVLAVPITSLLMSMRRGTTR